MAGRTLYEIAGVEPTTPPRQIAAAIEARLAMADEDERELLLHARNTLLDPLSRESYDRLKGLRGPLTPEERAAYVQGQIQEIAVEEVRRHEGSVFAELFFTMYLAAIALVFALWLVSLLYFVPGVAPAVTQIVALYKWEAYATQITIFLLTMPYTILAFLAIHLFEKQMQTVGRMILILGLNVTVIIMVLRRYELDSPYASIILLPVALQLLFVGFFFMRYLGRRDLEKILSPRTTQRRRK